ncbi:Plasmodium exported protein (Pm-fam-a like), unknown function [Plasmodium malariae]|uniref:Fam-m protein n=1 Tax=Plasmodium malariae TaxID=5858 RepID=A0A1A8XAU7_PLAMA|nr:Plasmodium exported protein (Pm-fam-a like), unknown function [Plasmodium malariae]
MEQKIKLVLYIKIGAFIILYWICHFSEVINFNKSFDVNYNFNIKLNRRIYRLLAKYKQNRDTNIIGVKDNIPYYSLNEKEHKSYKEKQTKRKKKHSGKNLLNNNRYYTEVLDYNNGMFDGKHFHLKKKWIKKKDYYDFIEKQRITGNIALKKIKFRSYGFGVFIFFLFFLFGIGLPILEGLGILETAGKMLVCSSDGKLTWFGDILNNIVNYLKLSEAAYKILPNVLLFVFLGVIIVIAIPIILRNNEKYKKIKLMMEQNQ